MKRFTAVIGSLGFVLLSIATPLGAQQAAAKMEGFPAAGEPAKITMLSTGTGAKRELRYVVPVGYKEHIHLSNKVAIAMEMMGMALPAMDMPGMNFDGDLTVTAVAPNGDISYSAVFGKMTLEQGGAPNAMADQLRPMLEQMGEMKGTFTIDNRGAVKNTTMDLKSLTDSPAAQAIGSIADSMKNMSTGLPADAVGVGAKWESRASATAGGMNSFVKTTTEVTAMDATSVTLKMTTEQSAPPQAINNPAMPAGAEASLDSMSGKGTSTSMVRLNGLGASGDSSMAITMAMKMSMGGDSQIMNMTTNVTSKTVSSPVK